MMRRPEHLHQAAHIQRVGWLQCDRLAHLTEGHPGQGTAGVCSIKPAVEFTVPHTCGLNKDDWSQWWGLPSICRLSFHCSMHAALESLFPTCIPCTVVLHCHTWHTECTFSLIRAHSKQISKPSGMHSKNVPRVETCSELQTSGTKVSRHI